MVQIMGLVCTNKEHIFRTTKAISEFSHFLGNAIPLKKNEK